MSITTAAANALDSKPHEQQIRECIDNLRGIGGSIIVLRKDIYQPSSCLCASSWLEIHTSSHQFKVEVTGSQYPSLAGGYGKKGKDQGILLYTKVKRDGNSVMSVNFYKMFSLNSKRKVKKRNQNKKKPPSDMTSITHGANWSVHSARCRMQFVSFLSLRGCLLISISIYIYILYACFCFLHWIYKATCICLDCK